MKHGLIAALLLGTPALAQDGASGRTALEVVHDWRAGPAAADLAAAFEARTPYRWVDDEAEDMVLVSRIIGGDPPDAALMSYGRQMTDLARAGVLLDLTAIAAAQGWREHMTDPALLDECTVDGRVFCVPATLRLDGWLILSRPAFARAGLDVPQGWDTLMDTAARLRAAGMTPLSVDDPSRLGALLAAFTLSAGGHADWLAAHRDGDAAAALGPAFAQGFEELGRARDAARAPADMDAAARGAGDLGPAAFISPDGSWSGAADGEHTCLSGSGRPGPLVITGEGFVFPDRRDAGIERAQMALAAVLLDPGVQSGLSNDLGVLPVQGSLDLTALHPCARRGLVALATGGSVPDRNLLVPPGTGEALDALLSAFWDDPAITPADLQARYAEAVARGR